MAVADAVLAIECNPVIRLRQFTVVSGSNMIPTASVTLVVNGAGNDQCSDGDGPSMPRCRCSGNPLPMCRYPLEEYHVDAISGGTDALVDVTVRLSKDGKIITSRGARTDIIMASVEAMIAGMNRLLRERHENRGKTPRRSTPARRDRDHLRLPWRLGAADL